MILDPIPGAGLQDPESVSSPARISSFSKDRVTNDVWLQRTRICFHRRPSGKVMEAQRQFQSRGAKMNCTLKAPTLQVGGTAPHADRQQLVIPGPLLPASQHSGLELSVPVILQDEESRPPKGRVTKTTQRGCREAGIQMQAA